MLGRAEEEGLQTHREQAFSGSLNIPRHLFLFPRSLLQRALVHWSFSFSLCCPRARSLARSRSRSWGHQLWRVLPPRSPTNASSLSFPSAVIAASWVLPYRPSHLQPPRQRQRSASPTDNPKLPPLQAPTWYYFFAWLSVISCRAPPAAPRGSPTSKQPPSPPHPPPPPPPQGAPTRIRTRSTRRTLAAPGQQHPPPATPTYLPPER